jgi:hypothetical protein
MQTFEVKYETPPALPPPYCYYYHIRGRETDGRTEIDFQWVYHNREDLSPEEIEAEGFSAQDDFQWKGTREAVWLQQFEQEIARTRKATRTEQDQPYLHITFKKEGKIRFDGEPQNLGPWDYFLQELIQAVYETAGKEAPLQLQFRKVNPSGTVHEARVMVQFRDRQVKVFISKGNPEPPSHIIAWEAMGHALHALYMLEPDDEKASQTAPERPGYFFESGTGLWFEPGKSAADPSPQNKFSRSVIQFMDQLFSAGRPPKER